LQRRQSKEKNIKDFQELFKIDDKKSERRKDIQSEGDLKRLVDEIRGKEDFARRFHDLIIRYY